MEVLSHISLEVDYCEPSNLCCSSNKYIVVVVVFMPNVDDICSREALT